ncbi:MAG: hypothetical protein ACJ73S_23225 [Mycobacteriales bacterium]
MRRYRPYWPLGALLAAGLALRVLAFVAYWPALWFPDSQHYLRNAVLSPHPDEQRPFGYPALVWIFAKSHAPAWTLAAFQNLLGLAVVAGIYLLVVRRGGPRWLAVVAAAPLALDANALLVEHYLLAEALFTALLAAAVGLLLWADRPGWLAATGAGLLFALSGLTRTVGLPLAGLGLLYLLVRRVGWRALAGFALAVVLPIGGYLVWYHSSHGVFATTQYSGRFLYGRVAPFADCTRTPVHGAEARLCETHHISGNPDDYVWHSNSPGRRYFPSVKDDPKLSDFATKVIEHQPVDYAKAVVRDTLKYFDLSRNDPAPFRKPLPYLDDRTVLCNQWMRFPADPAPAPPQQTQVSCAPMLQSYNPNLHPARTASNHAAARFLHAWSRIAVTPGPLLAIALLLGLAALARPGRLRWDAPVLALAGLALLVIPSATSLFDARYGVPALAVLPPAGALGLLAWLRRRTPPAEPEPEPATAEATA